MKFLDVRFEQPPDWLHPMQVFIREEDVVRYEELWAWNPLPEESYEYVLFYVRATDRERYRATLEAVESIIWYDLTPIDEESFYVYAREETRPEDRRFREAFDALDLVVVPPVIFDREGTIRMSVVGEGEHLQRLLEVVPQEITADVREIGEFDRRLRSVAGALTDRQFDALAAAQACGYYDVPRSGSLEDVASVLECAPSTASNHLQKAEAALVRQLLDRYA